MSESVMGTLYATSTVVSGFLLFTLGIGIDRWGSRTMTLWVFIPGLASACIVSSCINGYLAMWLSFFLLRFFSRGAMNMVPKVIVAHWFVKKRGRAMSLALIGGSISAIVLPPMNALLIEAVGWRNAWKIWLLLVLCIFLPLSICFYHSKPEDIGLEGEPVEISQA